MCELVLVVFDILGGMVDILGDCISFRRLAEQICTIGQLPAVAKGINTLKQNNTFKFRSVGDYSHLFMLTKIYCASAVTEGEIPRN